MTRRLFITVLATLVGVAGLVWLRAALPTVVAAPLAAQESDATAIGFGLSGETAFELIGKVEQRRTSVTFYGYLTYVSGFDSGLLFSDPEAASEATARLFFFGSANLSSSATVEGISVTSAEGSITIYYNDLGNATFAAPEGFFSGTAIADAELRLQLVVQDLSSGSGIASISADLTQISATPITIADQTYQFGQVDGRSRLSTVGVGTLSDATPPVTVVAVAGNVVIGASGTAATTTPTADETPTPVASATLPPITVVTTTPLSTGDECEGAEAWIDETQTRIARTIEIAGELEAASGVDDLDAATLSTYAKEFEDMSVAHWEVAYPPRATDARLLLFNAFKTYSRGVNLMAIAVQNQNDQAFSQAQTILQDGADIIVLGEEELGQVAAACGIDV